ncbi:MAG: alpha/beta hydrolase [Pseudomonadota bacterium]|nr:alpha/beta hydrolase [Pseudomonadota bacterium]
MQKHQSVPGVVWSYPIGPELYLRGREYIRGHESLIHFVHGNGFCGMTYWPVFRQLSEFFDICFHDTQGHGDSDDGDRFPGWNLTAERMAQVVHYRRRGWGNRRIVGCGHSFGGVLTLLAAARYPGMFDAVILLDPVLFPRSAGGLVAFSYYSGLSHISPLALQARKRTRYWPDAAHAWDYFYQRGIFKGWSDGALQCYLEYALHHHEDGSVTLKCPPWMEAQIFAGFPRGLWNAVKDVSCPVHIFYGRRTYPFIPPSVRTAARVNDMVSYAEVSGGHCFMQEEPGPTAERMLTWLQKQGF